MNLDIILYIHHILSAALFFLLVMASHSFLKTYLCVWHRREEVALGTHATVRDQVTGEDNLHPVNGGISNMVLMNIIHIVLINSLYRV